MEPTDAIKNPQDPKKLEILRKRFRALVLQNPNYFGNLEGSGFEPQANIAGNTFYEELGCIGYQPQTERLEAVVYVNQPSGYGGKLCSSGTPEYVRFYASWNNGGSWVDLGLSTFTAWDVPEGTEGRRRIEYAVTRRTDFARRRCQRPQIVLVRGILSWNAVPPANTPNHVPVWGNIHNTRILVEPLRRWRVSDLLEAVDVKAAPELTAALNLQTEFDVEPKPLTLDALKSLYKGADVPAKRFAFAHVANLLQNSGMAAGVAVTGGQGVLQQLGLEITDIEDFLGLDGQGDGNTSYEQLECIGYDPNDDSLVGVIRVKLPSGFSGNPCTDGSREYVTFWADLNNNGTFETCLGTAEVRVYDITDIPREGLEFAVHLPANLLRHRQPCEKGPRLIPIRAILSWATPVPCATPNRRPVWGNRLETLVHVRPGRVIDNGAEPLISSVGGIVVSDIIGALARNAVAVTTGAYFNDAPFGGRINIAGKIINGTAATRYRIMVHQQGGPPGFVPLPLEPVGFPIRIVTWPPLIITSTTQHLDPTGYYAYEDYAADHYVEGNILAVWQTGAAEHGHRFDLRVDIKDPLNPLVDIQSNVVTIEVDNNAPEITLNFTSLAGDCAHFAENTIFTGTFTATDPHFGGFSFEILPPGPAAGVLPAPASGASVSLGGTIGDPGVTAGTFTLNTAGMSPCGYALVLHANDRTNVNSGQSNNTNKDSVGFCLGNPPAG